MKKTFSCSLISEGLPTANGSINPSFCNPPTDPGLVHALGMYELEQYSISFLLLRGKTHYHRMPR